MKDKAELTKLLFDFGKAAQLASDDTGLMRMTLRAVQKLEELSDHPTPAPRAPEAERPEGPIPDPGKCPVPGCTLPAGHDYLCIFPTAKNEPPPIDWESRARAAEEELERLRKLEAMVKNPLFQRFLAEASTVLGAAHPTQGGGEDVREEGKEGLPPQGAGPAGLVLALPTPKRRTWFYTHKPADYEMSCDQCQGQNIEWSEFARRIWCHDCEIDTMGNGGVFDGPIPVELCAMLGIAFNIYHMRLKRVLYMHHDKLTGRARYWSHPPKAEDGGNNG